MKKYISALILFVGLSNFNAQRSVNQIIDSQFKKTTKILTENYTLKEVTNAYDLALNLSYFNCKQDNGDCGKYLVLPVISVDDKLAEESDLKAIPYHLVSGYNYSYGDKTKAIFGQSAKQGFLKISLKK